MSGTNRIILPWPDRLLSPNARAHWRAKAKAISHARAIGVILARDVRLTLPASGDLVLRLMLCPPNKKRRDMDNVLASLKAYLDGIFQAAGADDSQVRQLIMTWAEPNDYSENCVLVEIEKL